MNQIQTKAIILSRTDFGEADRIITLLTPEQGKLRLIAKGVRKIKSKLAGGIELFSVSDITFIRGRGDIGTLISARLDEHYSMIIKDIDRVQLGYEFIKTINKATEDEPEPAYFNLLQRSFQALDESSISNDVVRCWFQAQLLKLAGHTPNLQTDTTGHKLHQEQTYSFDFDAMTFQPHDTGPSNATQIKVLRLYFSENLPKTLNQIATINSVSVAIKPLLQTMLTSCIRV
jgi:DNA repair protein RecO